MEETRTPGIGHLKEKRTLAKLGRGRGHTGVRPGCRQFLTPVTKNFGPLLRQQMHLTSFTLSLARNLVWSERGARKGRVRSGSMRPWSMRAEAFREGAAYPDSGTAHSQGGGSWYLVIRVRARVSMYVFLFLLCGCVDVGTMRLDPWRGGRRDSSSIPRDDIGVRRK